MIINSTEHGSTSNWDMTHFIYFDKFMLECIAQVSRKLMAKFYIKINLQYLIIDIVEQK